MEIYIVCSGRSLRGFDFNLLKEKTVMAVNFAAEAVPWAKYLVALDKKFFEKADEFLKTYTGELHSADKYSDIDRKKHNVHFWPWRKVSGWDEYPYICHGWNSGMTAIHIACHLGYKQIRLLGFDLGGKGYFYSPSDHKLDIYDHVIRHARQFKHEIPKDISIINYSPESRCTAFIRKPLTKLRCVL